MELYQPEIITEYAGRMHRRSIIAIIACTALGFILGLALGDSMHRLLGGEAKLFIVAVCGAAVAAIGFFIGDHLAFRMKLQAQLALCQLKIEINTRSH
ncbi:hypothetical protein ACFL51_01755 [Myxococcota bacterium]